MCGNVGPIHTHTHTHTQSIISNFDKLTGNKTAIYVSVDLRVEARADLKISSMWIKRYRQCGHKDAVSVELSIK